MKELTGIELMEISGGWDWDDFLDGAAVGLGITAVAIATGGGALVGVAAVVAWTGAGVGVLNLYI